MSNNEMFLTTAQLREQNKALADEYSAENVITPQTTPKQFARLRRAYVKARSANQQRWAAWLANQYLTSEINPAAAAEVFERAWEKGRGETEDVEAEYASLAGVAS